MEKGISGITLEGVGMDDLIQLTRWISHRWLSIYLWTGILGSLLSIIVTPLFVIPTIALLIYIAFSDKIVKAWQRDRR